MAENIHDKIDWSRIGETIAGGRIILCIIPKGAADLEVDMVAYSKHSKVTPIHSRIVLFEKKLDLDQSIKDFWVVLMDEFLNRSNKRLDAKLKTIDDLHKETTINKILRWMRILK